MNILGKLEDYKSKQQYIRLTRTRGDFQDTSRGYVINCSTDFILLQNTDEFDFNGYCIFPIDTIKGVRHNKNDQFYDRIMKKEGLKDRIGNSFSIDLSNWKTVFQTLKKTKLTVTIECEEPQLDSFCIGTLEKIGAKSVSTFYFSPDGIIDKIATVTEYANITKITFDDRYANILGKYVKPGR